MKIAWFSEMGLEGTPSRQHSNLRCPEAWFVAQNAMHHNISRLLQLSDNEYDIGIIIIPKNVEAYMHLDVVSQLRRVCKKYALMQEGPSWFFQDLPLEQSLWFVNIMFNADFVLAHNNCDKEYYEGLLDKKCYINPTLMVEDPIDSKKLINSIDRKNVIIGGNLVRWYGGFNSLMVAKELGCDIYAPSMGRMHKSEKLVDDITHLPYAVWSDWIEQLSQFKYAIHLNPTLIAGTFNLNCAYLGIPCIGNINSNTQRICFPDLSIEPYDIKSAKKLIQKLCNDKDFYLYCSTSAKELYNANFSETKYLEAWNLILNDVHMGLI